MSDRSGKEIHDELMRLMEERVRIMKKRTFGGMNEAEFREEEAVLKRIRELSAEYLMALKRSGPTSK